MRIRIAILILLGCAGVIRADQVVAEVQQALKDEGFYYGQINGEKNADTTAAIRRYQIRNGLKITGELDDDTLKALRSVSPRPSPPAVANAPATTPVTAASPAQIQDQTAAATAAPEETPAGPRESSSGAGAIRRGEELYPPNVPNAPNVASQPGDLFADTPFANASPEQQHDVVVSAQRTLAQRGLYHGEIDGVFASPLEFSVRLEFEVFANPIETQIAFDRVVAAGTHGNFLTADNRDGGEISRGRGVNHDPINAAIMQRLAAQIKHRGVQIVEV